MGSLGKKTFHGDDWLLGAFTGGTSLFFTGDEKKPPEPKPLPAPVEEVDVAGQKSYTKARASQRKGRKSTLLSSKSTTKKTTLG